MYVDYHLHLESGPFTEEWAEEYFRMAEGLKVDELGFSEHLYRFQEAAGLCDRPFTRSRCTQDLDDYLGLLSRLRENGKNVKIGIECDYLPETEDAIGKFLQKYEWDYVIGSVHWLDDWGFDLKIGEWEGRDVTAVYEQYFKTLEKAIRSRLFDIIGHPDVIKVFGHRPAKDPTAWYKKIAKAMAECGSALDLNTSGLRKKVGEIYPAPGFLKAFYEAGVPLVTSSDAHRPADVGHAAPEAVALAKSAGYTHVSLFSKRQRSERPLA